MSNAVTFSFRKKETLQSENFDNDYLVTVENVNFNTEEEDDPFENENLFKDRIKPFVDYKEIATRFVNDLYKNANIDKIEPCDQLSNLIDPNVIDKRNEPGEDDSDDWVGFTLEITNINIKNNN